jgi:hypothetical protein
MHSKLHSPCAACRLQEDDQAQLRGLQDAQALALEGAAKARVGMHAHCLPLTVLRSLSTLGYHASCMQADASEAVARVRQAEALSSSRQASQEAARAQRAAAAAQKVPRSSHNRLG